MPTQSETPGAAKVEAAGHEGIDKLASGIADAEKKIRTAAEQAQADIRNAAEIAQKRGKEAQETVSAYVNEHPVAAVGFAFLGGIIAASLLRR